MSLCVEGMSGRLHKQDVPEALVVSLSCCGSWAVARPYLCPLLAAAPERGSETIPSGFSGCCVLCAHMPWDDPTARAPEGPVGVALHPQPCPGRT